ncbi:Patatin-like protein 2 [Pleurostoma richardsiae]|uniref:Patatin-like protein 2 n=1 Tax=Pleurostoma richardsiae TaxID=41990 RepID=A0AA38SG20_9PEZI|nr:Patatin-like protein 2 [Pleurostoma richardsiae]
MVSPDEDDPVNLLALDGGGIRGVSELVILHEIMLEIQRRDGLDHLPKPCEHFHIIGGTSTGGLIAIMLGRLRMSTAEALEEYDIFAKKIFRFRNRKANPSERFGATELEKTVQKIVARRGASDLMRDPSGGASDKGRSFVCAMPASERSQREPRRLRSYELGGDDDDHWDRNCRIWEAARATSAAPTYFKPMVITGADGEAETFIDAAMGCNNPSAWLLEEAGAVFDRTRQLGCVVSLGTGTRSAGLQRAPSALRSVSWGLKLIKLMKDIVVDCEKQHAEMETRFKGFPDTYFRFNVPNGAAKVGLAEYKKIPELKEMTGAYLREEAKEAIGKVADVLRKKTTRGLTVGHIRYPDEGLIVTGKRKAVPQGISSRNFTGRRDILDRLDSYFVPRVENGPPRREFLLWGMGGIGKTQIALKFAELHTDRFKNRIFWADATDQITLEQSYKGIAKRLFLDRSEKSLSVRDTVAWLEDATEEWLLILDNYSPSADMAAFFPSSDKGNILYTSRENTLKMSLPADSVIEVGVLGKDDSITLLLNSAKMAAETPESRTVAEPVVAELGNLPLAIDQAGAYIHMTETPLKAYLDIFKKRKKILLRDDRFKGVDARSLPVYASFDLSYDAIIAFTRGDKTSTRSQYARYALQIISMICFYHNEGLPIDMVRNAALLREKMNRRHHFPLRGGDLSPEELLDVDKQSGEWMPLNFEDGALLLEQFSLVKWDRTDQSLSMHVLIHSWRRDTMTETQRSDCGIAARSILFESLLLQDTADAISFRGKMIPHIFACQENVTARHEEPLLENEYDHRLATMIEEIGRVRDAEHVRRRCYETRRDIIGEDADVTLSALIHLADNLVRQLRFDEAEPMLKYALRSRIETFGENHQKTQSVKLSLANLYLVQARIDEAADLVSEVREARRDEFLTDGVERLGLWNTAGILAGFDSLRGQGPKSLQLAEEELAAAERLHGPDEPVTMRAKSRVAHCLMDNGRYEEAEGLLMEVYIYFKKVAGENHRDTIRARVACAACYYGQGRYIEAEALANLELDLVVESLDQDDSGLPFALYNLSTAIWMQGRLEEALKWAQKCLSLQESMLGPEHLATKTTQQLIEQLQVTAPSFTPYLRAKLRRKAVMRSRLAVGDAAPEWMVKEYEEALVFEARVQQYMDGDEKADEWIKQNVIRALGLQPVEAVEVLEQPHDQG